MCALFTFSSNPFEHIRTPSKKGKTQHFPRTLEGLLLHLVSPVGAEVLTRRFDEMDQLVTEQDSVFDDEFAVMDTLLNGKESFSRQELLRRRGAFTYTVYRHADAQM
nr:hypothetical protein [Tanacetum cinerariifolium]